MASTYSSLKIQLMTTGENLSTWGIVTNTNLGTAVEEAIAGSADVAFSSADVTLTLSNSNSTQAARNMRLNLTGTSGGARNLFVPAIEKMYVVNNGLADACTVKVSGQTGVAVPTGKTILLFNNGTDVVDAITHLSSLTLTSGLPLASGGTGQITQQAAINALTGTQTNNRVLRSDGTNATLAQLALATDVTGTLPVANGGTGVTSLPALGSLFYPVGSIYINATVSTNPGTLLGFGTWSAFGAGRMLISQNGTYTAGSTGGSAETTVSVAGSAAAHTLITAQIPSHTHTAGGNSGGSTGGNNIDSGQQTGATGGGGSHNHTVTATSIAVTTISPYVAVYMWQRTA